MALIVVLFTSPVNGAKSWFVIGPFSFQPGEFAKICIILFLAYIISKICKNREDINRPLNLLKIIAIAFLPIVLIALEPDFGTGVVIVMTIIVLLFVSGVKMNFFRRAVGHDQRRSQDVVTVKA